MVIRYDEGDRRNAAAQSIDQRGVRRAEEDSEEVLPHVAVTFFLDR